MIGIVVLLLSLNHKVEKMERVKIYTTGGEVREVTPGVDFEILDNGMVVPLEPSQEIPAAEVTPTEGTEI